MCCVRALLGACVMSYMHADGARGRRCVLLRAFALALRLSSSAAVPRTAREARRCEKA